MTGTNDVVGSATPVVRGAGGAPHASRIRLPFLDGVRGIAALYVVLFHTVTMALPQTGELSPPTRFILQVLDHGHLAVAIFIVLSGFSLTLPMARSGTLELAGGVSQFMRRRAKRLLPPYYAALVFSIIAIVAYKGLQSGGGDGKYDVALSPGSVISHIFMIHNLSFDWAFRINGPMWTVATEWQIYILLPLVLLPMWRRFGATVTVVTVWALCAVLYWAVPSNVNLYWAAPWYVGSFALGLWGAIIVFSDASNGSRLRALPWKWVSLSSLAVLVVLVATNHAPTLMIQDLLVSIATVAYICHAALRAHDRQPLGITTRLMSSRPFVYLGGFSYSLYLLQHPLLRLLEKFLGDVSSLSLEQALGVAVFVGVPLMMVVSWFFSLVFERPFTTGDVIVPFLRRLRRRASSPVPMGTVAVSEAGPA